MKPLPILSNMPPHIRDRIVDDTDTPTKLALRQCSKLFKFHVDRAKTHYDCLKIELLSEAVGIMLIVDKNHYMGVRYQQDGRGYLIRNENENHTKTVPHGDYLEAAANHVKKIIRNQRVSLGELAMNSVGWRNRGVPDPPNVREFLQVMEDALAHYGRHIPVSKIFIDFEGSGSTIIPILSLICPGSLTTISLKNTFENPLSASSLINLHQWRDAKSFVADLCVIDVPYEHWRHFDWFKGFYATLTLEFVKPLIEDFLSRSGVRTVSIDYKRIIEIQTIVDYLTERMGDPENKLRWEKRYPQTNEVVWVWMNGSPSGTDRIFFIQRA